MTRNEWPKRTHAPVLIAGMATALGVDTFYADFWNRFPDANLLKGMFANGDTQLSVEQLQPGVGPCNRR